jgi:three-Cys-motif partner protein
MVALRRPDELPPPPEDGLPTRPIKRHSLDKLHYWGCYLEAASTALKHKFPTRVCADLFAAYGVCSDKDGTKHWGSALLALQVATPFEVYFFNDLNPDAARALAHRAAEIGIARASIHTLDLNDPEHLRRAREIGRLRSIGPKIVVSTGDANKAHYALKEVAGLGPRYMCAVIDPASAVYEWEAFEALAYTEKALDTLVLFPDAMDLGRGLPYYLRQGKGDKLDRCFGPVGMREWREIARQAAHPESALRALYENQMRSLIGLEVGRPRTVTRTGTKMALYRLVFGSRNQKGIDIWNDICRRTRDEQYEMFLGDV